ncbi:glycosyltransferase [Synechococcus sp. BA-120 BA3]|nr:glycosyltransferase [Synechococcus sp. BA-120 BA3]
MNPQVSVLMPCLNAGPFLHEAITSALAQPEILEVLLADAGSTDGSLEQIEEWSHRDHRLRLVSRRDTGPADALNQASARARGSLIGWLNADDLYPPGCLQRAVAALANHPDWLMVYGEGEEFDDASGFLRPYPTVLPCAGLEGQRNHCGICQPAVLWRRSMGVLLGPFNTNLNTAFDYDYWLRAFTAFPHRIGYLPHLQGRTRLHSSSITSLQRGLVAVETTRLQATYFGSASGRNLHNYGLELQAGHAQLPADQTLFQQMDKVIAQASTALSPHAEAWLRQTWCPQADAQLKEQQAAQLQLQKCHSVRILQIAHPQLCLKAPSPPAGPHRRLLAGIDQHGPYSLLLQQDDVLHQRYPRLKGSSPSPPQPSSHSPWSDRPFGVNLIGHAFHVFGVGEDIRMAARALAAADVPFTVIDVPAFNGSATNDRSLEDLIHPGPSGPYAFNLICLQPISHAQWLLQNGLTPQQGHYTIAAWPWETDRWPQAWEPLLEHCDELWPASSYIHRVLQPMAAQHAIPIHTMPMAVDITATNVKISEQQRRTLRHQFHLPLSATLFVYSFDFNSTTIRKNPHAVIEAFQLAFPDQQQQKVALVIKVLSPSPASHDWQWLQARLLEDPRIKLIAENLGREDLLNLYACCDAFVSLHRSEGFGRSLAEALQLGLAVIATDHGGNTDFCQGPLAHPVPWRSVPIPPQAYPPADERHRWAEPDIASAAKSMKTIAAMDGAREADVAEATVAYKQQFSPHSVGERYRRRLEAIWQQP